MMEMTAACKLENWGGQKLLLLSLVKCSSALREQLCRDSVLALILAPSILWSLKF